MHLTGAVSLASHWCSESCISLVQSCFSFPNLISSASLFLGCFPPSNQSRRGLSGTCVFSTQGEMPAEVAGGAEALEQMLQEFGAAGPVALLALISLPTSRPCSVLLPWPAWVDTCLVSSLLAKTRSSLLFMSLSAGGCLRAVPPSSMQQTNIRCSRRAGCETDWRGCRLPGAAGCTRLMEVGGQQDGHD